MTRTTLAGIVDIVATFPDRTADEFADLSRRALAAHKKRFAGKADYTPPTIAQFAEEFGRLVSSDEVRARNVIVVERPPWIPAVAP
jgi:hypothetical protein